MKVDTLLEPMVAPPSHSHLIEVFKKRYEPDEVGVLKQLLLHIVNWNLNILEIVPLEKSGFTLC